MFLSVGMYCLCPLPFPPCKGTSLNMAALALAGYSTQADALWQKTCRELKDSLKEPYLKAMFSFLTKDFSSVLVSPAHIHQAALMW